MTITDMSDLPANIQQYLLYYPSQPAYSGTKNVEFYTNQLRSSPDNILISQFQSWQGQYDTLESRHGYIQWLFPIREMGVNSAAQPLTLFEAQRLHRHPQVVTNFKVMLDFYGFRVDDGLHITVTENYQERFHNLLSRRHNFLRITRILKCLSELGYEEWGVSWLLCVMVQQSMHRLDTTEIKASMDRWWCNCFRNDENREFVNHIRESVRRGEVLTDEKYREYLKNRKSGHWHN